MQNISPSINSETRESAAPSYRPAKPLPYELREHCTIYFEEELYSQALNLLNNTLIAGSSVETATGRLPAFVPPTEHLSFAATLVVHPSLTTRASSAERVQASNEAIILLRNVNKLVGPLNAKLSTAFTFHSAHNSRRRVSGRRGEPAAELAESDEEDGGINSELAKGASVWMRAKDIWDIVGWAFNCSVNHRKRWERWRLWLELILEVLEDDFAVRKRLNQAAEGGRSGENLLAKSMIMQNLSASGARAERRRILRAVFADGSSKSTSEFSEVFKNELKERKKEPDVMKRLSKKVNIDENEYGDYDEEDEEEPEEEVTRRSSVKRPASNRQTPDSSDPDTEDSDTAGSPEPDKDAVDKFGGIDSIILRQRILALLLQVSAAIPTQFVEVEDLFDVYTEFIRPLPLPVFSLLVSPSALPHFDHHSQSSLNQMLFRALASSAPHYDENNLNQEDLERFFLPYPASSTGVIDNAKVSLLLESLLLLVHRHIGLEPKETLGLSVEEGISARNARAEIDGYKKMTPRRRRETEAKAWLTLSAQRIMALLEMVESD